MGRFDTKVRGKKYGEIVETLKSSDVVFRIFPTKARKQYSEFLGSLEILKDITNKLYEKNRYKGYPLLDDPSEDNFGTNLSKLKDAYKDVIESTAALRSSLMMNEKILGDKHESTISALHALDAEIASDISILNTFSSDEKLTLPELMYRSSVKTYDLSNVNEVTGDAKQSSGMAVELVNSSGNTVKGFFTESTSFDPIPFFREEAGKISEKYKNQIPQNLMDIYQMTVDDIVNKKNLDYILGLGKEDEKTKESRNLEDYAKNNLKLFSGLSRKERNTLSDMFMDLTMDMSFNKSQKDISNYSRKVTFGSNIDRRAGAVSDIASLLGMSELVVESEDINVKNKEGEIVSGTFTKMPDGVPLEAVQFTGKSEQFTAEAKRQLADLQVLDYLCFNTDRRPNNIFYKQDSKNRITGIVGINNDASFGAETGFNGDMNNRLTNISQIKFMSLDMANALSNVDLRKVKSVLQARNLPDKEITATLKRFNDCMKVAQKAVNRIDDINAKDLDKNNVTVSLTENGFDAVKMEKIAKKNYERDNLFNALVTHSINFADKAPKNFEQIDMSDKRARQTDASEKTKDSLEKTLSSLKEYKAKLKKATGIRGSSKNYNEMQAALDSSIEIFEGVLPQNGITKLTVSVSDYTACMKSLEKVYDAADHYVVNKEKEKNPSNYAKNRLSLAKEFRNTLSETFSQMKFKQDRERDEMEVMNINKISSKMLEDIIKTEDTLKDFDKKKTPQEKAGVIFSELPRLSAQAYASFDGKIGKLIHDEKGKLPSDVYQRLIVAKTISYICRKGREATSILAVNSENRKEKLGKGKTFSSIDECKLAFAKMQLVENVINSKDCLSVQRVFEQYDKKRKDIGLKGKSLDRVLEDVVKKGKFYNDFKKMDFKETLRLLDNSSIKNRKEFISISADVGDFLKIPGNVAKIDNPTYMRENNRIL